MLTITASSKNEDLEQYNMFNKKYKENTKIINKVPSHIDLILPLFEENPAIRKMIYTTNAIESVNSSLRKNTNDKEIFVNKESLYKVLYLRILNLEKMN